METETPNGLLLSTPRWRCPPHQHGPAFAVSITPNSCSTAIGPARSPVRDSEQMVEVITASAPGPILLLRSSLGRAESLHNNWRGRWRRCRRNLASERVLPLHPRILQRELRAGIV